jgi:hypothetical protein
MDLKKIILLICAGVGLWFGWDAFNNRGLSERSIATFYKDATVAFMNRDSEAYCRMFADDLRGSIEIRIPNAPLPAERKTLTRKDACRAIDETYAMKQEMEANAKTPLEFDYRTTIKSIALEPDKQSATVTLYEELRIGNKRVSLMAVKSEQTAKIRLQAGKIEVFQSDSRNNLFFGERR